MGKLFNFIGRILTLNILPGAYDMVRDTHIKGNHTIWFIGWIISPIINYFFTLFINIVDFICIFINWIPIIGDIQKFIYHAPDIDQQGYDAVYNFIEPLVGTVHRNWITHSVLNPYFILFVICAFVIAFIAKFIPVVKYIAAFLILMIGLTFVCHLIADTMPGGWGRGSSNNFSKIHVRFWFIKFQLNGLFTKLWLYINALIAGVSIKSATEIAAAE